MVDADKIAGTAAGLAQQAAELADQVKDKLGDAVGKAIPIAVDLATKAGDAAAQGVDAVGGTLNAVTGGRVSSQIDAVTSTIKDALPTTE